MSESAVKRQYERFPYPTISALALPRRDQGGGLQYERAVELAHAGELQAIAPAGHDGIRILVAGCGTLEALVVAQVHPRAAEVIALDLSRRSLATLQRRIRWARARDTLHLAGLRGHRLAPIRLVEADVRDWRDAQGFDYILANNLLHHTDDPAATLQHLAGLLKPGGVLRIVTYPAKSRFWIRQTGAWLQWHGLTPETDNLKRRAVDVINELPQSHPLRNCFEAHGETANMVGLVDAFFHACEKPLAPLQWRQASEAAGLEWLGESQSHCSRAEFLTELLPATKTLSSWRRLQVLDDVLELSGNPVWWFCRRGEIRQATDDAFFSGAVPAGELVTEERISALTVQLHREWYLPSAIYWKLGRGLRRADAILQQSGCSVEELIEVLRREVGLRETRDGRMLSGLTIGEYPTNGLLQAERPVTDAYWRQLQTELGPSAGLKYKNETVPGDDLLQQVSWLQLYYGPFQSRIGPLSIQCQ